jgi:hypothetical protein
MRDRSGLLTLVGVVEILLGALSLAVGVLGVAAIAIGARLSPAMEAVPRSALVLDLAFYAGTGAFLFTMGVGTMRAKRWARAMMLVVCWPGMLGILLGSILLAFVAPVLLQGISDDPVNTRNVAIVLFAVCGVLALVPLAFIVFYERPSVREMFASRDPRPTWVDSRPLPILGMALALVAGGAGMVLSAPWHLTIQFGYVLTDWRAAVVTALNGLVWTWLGLQIYWMTKGGWWANVVWGTVAHLSVWISLRRIPLASMFWLYQGRHNGDDATTAFTTTFDAYAAWLVAASLLIWIGTLLWLRRYYRPEGNPLRSTASPPC